MSTWPDVEGALRTYLRSRSAITAKVGQRVFFGVPKAATDRDWPMITVQRVGGGADPGDAPVDRALVQLDCWGIIDASGNGIKSSCMALANAVRSELELANDTMLDAHVRATLTVESIVWLPDPANDRPRYVVTADVSAIYV